jgi:hypothetical protein
MNIFTTLEQSSRLKAAGFPQGKTEYGYVADPFFMGVSDSPKAWLLCQGRRNDAAHSYDAPTAAEIMEELRDEVQFVSWDSYTKKWYVKFWNKVEQASSPALLSTLVEAYVASRAQSTSCDLCGKLAPRSCGVAVEERTAEDSRYCPVCRYTKPVDEFEGDFGICMKCVKKSDDNDSITNTPEFGQCFTCPDCGAVLKAGFVKHRI